MGRIAIYVGHNLNTGARSFDDQDEWASRNHIAFLAQPTLTAMGHEVIVGQRNPALGYSSAMAEHGRTSREFDADVSVELHFNCYHDPQANGAELLVYSESTARTLGLAFTDAFDEFYPDSVLRSGGVKVNTDGNGSGFNRRQHCPSGIWEPCFASNPEEWPIFRDDPEREASCLIRMFQLFFNDD